MARSIEQSVFWDERADAWALHADAMEAFARQFGDPAMEVLDLRAGQHVADVGCGPGLTTIDLAARVAPSGTATGVDVSSRMVETARGRAEASPVDNARFVVGDPGLGPLGSFDAVYSRFGVMFFDEPAVAFANLARSLRPGGRLVAAVWAELDANPWMVLPTLVAAGPLEADLVLPAPGEPGPFSLADPGEALALLESCGFVAVDVGRLEGAWTFDDHTADAAIAQMLAVGALGEAWAAADDDARATAVEAVRAACDEHRGAGGFRVPAAALVLSASVRS